MVANHPALDFLNTVMVVNGECTDTLVCDDDVVERLNEAGFPS
jgi:hypothetical protein